MSVIEFAPLHHIPSPAQLPASYKQSRCQQHGSWFLAVWHHFIVPASSAPSWHVSWKINKQCRHTVSDKDKGSVARYMSGACWMEMDESGTRSWSPSPLIASGLHVFLQSLHTSLNAPWGCKTVIQWEDPPYVWCLLKSSNMEPMDGKWLGNFGHIFKLKSHDM